MTDAVDEVVPATLAGERVDRVVAMLTGLPRQRVAELVAAGGVRIDGEPVRTRSRRVVEGEVLHVDDVADVDETALGDAAVRIAVVHADEEVIVVDKPAGLVVHPGAGVASGTLVNGLVDQYPDVAGVGPDPSRPGIVHRLDQGTSGLLVVARTAAAYESLVGQLGARGVDRRYVALVLGQVESEQGVIDAPIGRHPRDHTRMAVVAAGKDARTRYEVRDRFVEPVLSTLVGCRLETGRTHQIRVHLAAIGHPVAGDPRYGGGRALPALGRPFLHAELLAFDHPGTGARMTFTSAIPTDLDDILRTCRRAV